MSNVLGPTQNLSVGSVCPDAVHHRKAEFSFRQILTETFIALVLHCKIA